MCLYVWATHLAPCYCDWTAHCLDVVFDVTSYLKNAVTRVGTCNPCRCLNGQTESYKTPRSLTTTIHLRPCLLTLEGAIAELAFVVEVAEPHLLPQRLDSQSGTILCLQIVRYQRVYS